MQLPCLVLQELGAQNKTIWPIDKERHGFGKVAVMRTRGWLKVIVKPTTAIKVTNRDSKATVLLQRR